MLGPPVQRRVVSGRHSLSRGQQVRRGVIFDLTAEAGDYLGGIGTYAAHRGKNRREFYTDPQVKEDYKATLRYVLGRTNSVTGVPYRDDKAILAWQFGNEMNGAPPEWIAEMAAYIKGLDGSHLAADARHVPGEPPWKTRIDLYTRHYYGGNPGRLAGIRREVTPLKGERPFFVGEFGLCRRGSITGQRRRQSPAVPRRSAAAVGAGALLWSMHHGQGGSPGTRFSPIRASGRITGGLPQRERRKIGTARCAAAFKIQGLPVPPSPIPIAGAAGGGDVPMFVAGSAALAAIYYRARRRMGRGRGSSRTSRAGGLPAAVQRHHRRPEKLVLSR